MSTETLDKISQLHEKWRLFKYLRNNLQEFGHEHPDYMTVIQREELVDTLFENMDSHISNQHIADVLWDIFKYLRQVNTKIGRLEKKTNKVVEFVDEAYG